MAQNTSFDCSYLLGFQAGYDWPDNIESWYTRARKQWLRVNKMDPKRPPAVKLVWTFRGWGVVVYPTELISIY
jgi:hypothetical protein